MAKLTAAQRKKIPKSEMGLPGEGKYPMPDASHAANAKARATQEVKKGNLSSSAKARIDAKANSVLKKKRGGVNVAKVTGNIRDRIANHSKNKTQIGF
jgi:hypothetical protein